MVCLAHKIRILIGFFGGGSMEEEEEKIAKGDDVIIDLDASLKIYTWVVRRRYAF